jgi:hypothetical protein
MRLSRQVKQPNTVLRIYAALSASCVLGVSAHGGDVRTTIQSMQWERRVVLLAAADANDPSFKAQHQSLSSWAGASERDVSLVEIAGDRVSGSTDTALNLRAQYGLPKNHFVVLLIGKDGHVALRSTSPVTAGVLMETIDAMPMRRAGQR